MRGLGLLALSGSSELFILFWVVVLLLLVAPILAIAAWIRVRRLERRGLPPAPTDAAQLNALDRRLADVERKLAAPLALAGLAALAVAAAAELPLAWQHWRYLRALELEPTPEARLVKVTVPIEVYGKAGTDLPDRQAGLADLRLIDDTGREVAFVLEARLGRRSREWRTASVVDFGYFPELYTYAVVVVPPEVERHNSLEILTDVADFFAWVEVAASDALPAPEQEKTAWRIVRERAPIYRFRREEVEGAQTIGYPETRARYLRLRITREDKKNLVVRACRVAHEVVEAAELVRLLAKSVSRPEAPPGQSKWQVDLGTNQVPVSEVRFAVEQAQFHRPVEVWASDDGEHWTLAGAGDIHRYSTPGSNQPQASLTVEFSEARGRYWRVVVHNRNDPPLEGLTVELYGTPRQVVFQQEPQRSYRLLYGNERAEAPQYELARLARLGDGQADPAEFGKAVGGAVGTEEVNTAWVDPRPWSERHPLVLWVALGIAVVVLALLAIRSLRQPPAPPAELGRMAG